MSIQAKKEGLLRLLGMLLILIGFVGLTIIDISVLNNPLLYLFLIIILIPWFLIIILLKLEIELIVENNQLSIVFLIIYSIIFIIIGSIFSFNIIKAAIFVGISISNIIILINWKFALSIYKKEKYVFLITLICFVILSFIFRISNILMLVPLIIIIVGNLLIILSEYNMKKKGLLNYI